MKRFKFLRPIIFIGLAFIFFPESHAAWAHTSYYDGNGEIIGLTSILPQEQAQLQDGILIDLNGVNNSFEVMHEEAAPDSSLPNDDYNKGWFGIWCKNGGLDAWGDFHFEIRWFDDDANGYQPWGGDRRYDWGGKIAAIKILKAWNYFKGEFDPVVNDIQDGDGNVIGATVDFFFYDTPITSEDEPFLFAIYTDNTTLETDEFLITAYPTPVPIPGAIWFLGSGILAIIGSRKKSKQK